MELKEEKELIKAIERFTAAVKIFQAKECEKAIGAFEDFLKQYEDSEYYSVLEICGRAQVYRNICQSKLNPVKVELESDENYLNEGIFNLNAGHLNRARELLEPLLKKKYREAYVNYLLSLVHLKKREISTAVDYLKKAVQKNDFYRTIAHNEPDFENLFENETFLAIIEEDRHDRSLSYES
jgi:tetratricopeptide (TPR) repeat protein